MASATQHLLDTGKKYLGIFITVCAAITTIYGASLIVSPIYDAFRYKTSLYEQIDALATETNVNYFKSILGEPIYENQGRSQGIKEYIFVNRYFYVQAITTAEDKVLAYSVTTRDSHFNPKVPLYDLQLGKSTFEDLGIHTASSSPDLVISYLGAHDLFYTEGYWGGNPHGYQTFFFSMTMSGYTNYDNYTTVPDYESPNLLGGFKSLFGNIESTTSFPKVVLDYWQRNTNTINTYTILGPFVSFADIASIRDGSPYFYIFGPDYNQIRLLNK